MTAWRLRDIKKLRIVYFDALHVWFREAEVHAFVEDLEGDIIVIKDVVADMSVCIAFTLLGHLLTVR